MNLYIKPICITEQIVNNNYLLQSSIVNNTKETLEKVEYSNSYQKFLWND